MLCFESSLFCFLLLERNSYLHKLKRKLSPGLSTSCFLIVSSWKTMLLLFSAKGTQVSVSTKLCISPISCQILPNPELIFSCHACYCYSKYSLSDDSTCATSLMWNAATRHVPTNVPRLCRLQPVLLSHIKIKAQKKHKCKVRELSFSNVSNFSEEPHRTVVAWKSPLNSQN